MVKLVADQMNYAEDKIYSVTSSLQVAGATPVWLSVPPCPLPSAQGTGGGRSICGDTCTDHRTRRDHQVSHSQLVGRPSLSNLLGNNWTICPNLSHHQILIKKKYKTWVEMYIWQLFISELKSMLTIKSYMWLGESLGQDLLKAQFLLFYGVGGGGMPTLSITKQCLI